MFNRRKSIQRPTGLRAFLIMWSGQIVSALGTAMTGFALVIWMWEETHQATPLAVALFFNWGAYLLMAPLAGIVVDRYDRRLVLIAGDAAAALMTIGLFVLYVFGDLRIWHLYVVHVLVGIFDAFQVPARTALISLLVPKEHYGRANGLRSVANFGPRILAPALAGLLLPLIDVSGVMLIDIATFLIAVAAFAAIVVSPAPPAADDETGVGLIKQLHFGFRYLWQRPGLLWLALAFTVINTAAALTWFSLVSPMVLARSGGSQAALAAVQSAIGLGGVAGAVVMSVWGGPRRRIHGFLLGTAFSFLLGDFLFGVGRTPFAWAAAGFLAAAFIPILVGANQAICQAKVPPALQGRVLNAADWIGQAMMPLGYLATGPLADRVLEPAMQPGGALVDTFGGLVGVGPGAGMALLFLLTGTMGVLTGLGGYLIPALRSVEDRLPDHDEVAVTVGGAVGAEAGI